MTSSFPGEPERAQIVFEGADHPYKEIRIENTLTDANGEEVHLKLGAKVEVTVEAKPQATTARARTRAKSSEQLGKTPRDVYLTVQN